MTSISPALLLTGLSEPGRLTNTPSSYSVYVHPDFRRRGIARQLLQVLVDYATTQHIHTIIAGIDADNQGSILLHQQFGFTETAHFKEVGYKFGKWLDLKFFQLILHNDLQPNEH